MTPPGPLVDRPMEPIYGSPAKEECLAALAEESQRIQRQAKELLQLANAGRDQVVRALLLRVEELGWEHIRAPGEMPGISAEANAVGSCLFLLAQLELPPGIESIQPAALHELIRLARAHTEAHMAGEEVRFGLRDASLLPPDRTVCLQPNRVRNADIGRWRRAIERSTEAARPEAERYVASMSPTEVMALRSEIQATGRLDSQTGVLSLPEPRPLLDRVSGHAIALRRRAFEHELSFVADENSALSGGLTVGLFLRVLTAIQQEAYMRRIVLNVLSEEEAPLEPLLMDLDDSQALDRVAQKSGASLAEVSSVVDALVSNTARRGRHSDFRTESRPGSLISGRRFLGSFAAISLHAVHWVEENLVDEDCGDVFEARVAKALERLGGRLARQVEFALATGESSELDISILWGDHLFLIECKARALGFGRIDRIKHAHEAIEEGSGQLSLARRWIKEQPHDAERQLGLRRNTLRRATVHPLIAIASAWLDETMVGGIRALRAARVFSHELRKPGDLVALLHEPVDHVVPEDPYFRSFGGRPFIVFP
jgi:hypothetical protein